MTEEQTQEQADAPPRKTLIEDLAFIGSRIGSIQKTGSTSGLPYKFVEHHHVVSKASPLLHKAGIIVVPESRERSIGGIGNRRIANIVLAVKFMRQRPGCEVEVVEAVVDGEGADNGDKSLSKATTQAMKKAYMVVLGLPVDEGLDAAAKFDRR